ncbi:hypothetical protein [Devosia alba]|uniref:hypothetical protein n=1 Tax=Devosia alba TaxID=3152360 RepID=UPI0032655F4C
MTDLSAKLDDGQKELVLLSIVNAMGGQTDAGDERWSWLQWFCADEVGSEADTFNRCIDKGWLKSSHDSDTDHSVAWITDEGRQALAQKSLRTTEAGEVVATMHRHVKRGTDYVLIGIGKMQTEDWFWVRGSRELVPVDMDEVAIYRSVDDGSLWVRPKGEFEDGRFVALSALEHQP